ncbi:MAG: hypothetical protein R3D63_06845 [Paracoccaceae bacterium]
MSGSSTETLKEFYCIEDGLTFTVRVYQLPDGSFEAKITVFEGSADFNAVYFGDGVDDGSSTNLNGNLNMSGAGSVDHDGNAVDWDNATVLSKPGLGPSGEDKPTYLSTGRSYTFALDIDSLDEIQDIGVRATSTSTPEGSIKCVLDPIEEDHDAASADEAEILADGDDGEDSDDSDDSDGDTARTAEPAAEEAAQDVPLEDLSDAEYYELLASSAGTVDEDAPADDQDMPEEDLAVF